MAAKSPHPLKTHVLLDPDQEENCAFTPTPVPAIKTHSRLVIEDQYARALGYFLAQALGLDALERAHVVFLQSLPVRQMPQRVPAQVQRVEMVHRYFPVFEIGIVLISVFEKVLLSLRV